MRPGFYARDVCTVARELIGCVVRHGACSGVIVETEAYHESEPACHAFAGLTARTQTLFGPPGRAYVYRSYGIHALLKIRVVLNPIRRIDINHLHVAAHAFVVDERFHQMQGITADKFILPSFVMGVELHALRFVRFTQRFFQVGKDGPECQLRSFLGSQRASTFDDVSNTRVGDNFVPLQR